MKAPLQWGGWHYNYRLDQYENLLRIGDMQYQSVVPGAKIRSCKSDHERQVIADTQIRNDEKHMRKTLRELKVT